MADGAAGDIEAVADFSFQLMDEVAGKLSLLNYEAEFCEPNDILPFPPGYFAVPSHNPGLQFQNFLELAAFLLRTAGNDCRVNMDDDPTSQVNDLMLDLRASGFTADFPLTKLRTAHGEPALKVLSHLTNVAVKARKFNFASPVYPSEAFAEVEGDEEGEDEDEIEDEVEEAGVTEVLFRERAEEDVPGGGKDAVLATDTDPVAWRAEVERAIPLLRARMRRTGASAVEWRSHWEETRGSKATLDEALPTAQGELARTSGVLNASLEQVDSKEKFLNATHKVALDSLRETQGKVQALRTAERKQTSTLQSLRADLDRLAEEAERVQEELEGKGTTDDTSPIVRLKKALEGLKREVRSLDLRTGVLVHQLMQARIVRAGDRDRTAARPADHTAELGAALDLSDGGDAAADASGLASSPSSAAPRTGGFSFGRRAIRA